MNLETEFLGVKFKNPLVLASGILGVTASSLKNVVKNGAGGVTTKSIWMEEHKGHNNPVMFGNEHWFMNAVGLSDAGVEKAKVEIGEYMKDKPAPLIASVVAAKKDEFGEITEKVSELNPDIIEVNISCPNVEDEFGKPFACVAEDAAAVTKLTREKTKLPLVIKLSPNVPNIASIAKACVDSGADGICAINTVGPGMAIDINMRAPILANKVGGVSGPAIKPIAIKAVYDIHKALPSTPIIGMGGVLSGEDAIEMIMAGATLVGMGTAVYYRDIKCFDLVANEMSEWCKNSSISSLDEILGAAQQ
jgi:dihydroorotate dehydrogenase (NAD+) catalytic subunit